ncbi:uncharacterized protein CANTADRAFT_326745 [Suhomyces tanzawaensis NRRL Y-17324]|uniref:Uncharacterized protein n=1 Tax=Suhomyces tanzawaensis NRRL Y-17324 TaxID=984487 RepID=A0A1E4SC77_9ASCO|nr:uncharacterized protein CANTADRAFT_326745 [Suhomyces tanzawaensis NRRL Y-17324]ODV77121.1 hypothetical protein CANTADRAFT_326745 [Suhomyces tanzawaensis NRRL Y-17324]
MAMDSTQDLLSNYQSTHDDNLSLYSISGELNHQLSEMYDMLEDDSIEIRRSQSITQSPFKTSSPLRLSPTKKLKNDYQDHIFRARSGNLDSPVKKKRPDLDWSRLDLEDSPSYDSIEHKIERFLAGNKAQGEPETAGLEEFDKTELVIKETHKLINNVPASVLNNKEGEKYSQLLGSSLAKIIKSLEAVKSENRALKGERDRAGDKHAHERVQADAAMGRLKTQNSRLEEENSRLREDNAQLTRKLGQQVPQINAQVGKENQLLREKLIKYKNRSSELEREVEVMREEMNKIRGRLDSVGHERNQSPLGSAPPERSVPPSASSAPPATNPPSTIPSSSTISSTTSLASLALLIAHFLRHESEHELVRRLAQYISANTSHHQPQAAPAVPEAAPTAPETAPTAPETAPTAPEAAPTVPEAAPPVPESPLVAVLHQLVGKMQPHQGDAQLGRLTAAVDVNNQLLARFMDREVPHASSDGVPHAETACRCGGGGDGGSSSAGSGGAQSDEVFLEASQRLGAPASACPRCSSVRNDTLNLMGEYQWSV